MKKENSENQIADEFLKEKIEEAKKDHDKAVDLYKSYCMGKDLTDEERTRRIHGFRCG